ncbi:MAG: hypothetical protein IT489_07545 [Gammaproteobacteria bacterium]|nr:hypothetical protein [Gammaproteobacteria bacterium]
MNTDTIQNINAAERLVRLAFSLTLTVVPLFADAPLGGLALLPLLAIYPGLTAALGWDPVLAAVTGRCRQDPAVEPGHGLAGHA